jgi:hypothetical protein
VDSLVAQWRSGSRDYQIAALDLQSVVERERGEFRAAERTLRRVSDQYHDGGLSLLHANTLARVGSPDQAAREYETMTDHGARPEPSSPVQSLAGDRARSFAWHHALEADAIGRSVPLSRLNALADSIERIGARSYYARDWRLYHHVRGVAAIREGRFADAVSELSQARFGIAGWTRTNALLADAYLGEHDAVSAIRVLRQAYEAPPDAMGRYLPRSELDARLARSFAAAGLLDSAKIYARYAANAWTNPDAEVRSMRDEMMSLLRAP